MILPEASFLQKLPLDKKIVPSNHFAKTQIENQPQQKTYKEISSKISTLEKLHPTLHAFLLISVVLYQTQTNLWFKLCSFQEKFN